MKGYHFHVVENLLGDSDFSIDDVHGDVGIE